MPAIVNDSLAIPRRRGFAGMDPQRQRDIAREGGRAAHEQGKAHEFSPSEARAAGLKSQRVRSARLQCNGEGDDIAR